MSLLKQKIELKIETAEFEAKQALDRLPGAIRWLLIFSLLASLPVYLVVKNLSYNSWNKVYQNYLLEAKPSFENAREPAVGDVLVTSTGNGNYAAGVQITNENVDLSLTRAAYEFIFTDEAGEQVYSETGETFLLPNQTKFVVAPRFTSQAPVRGAQFRWNGDLHWQKRAEIAQIDLQPSQTDTYNQFQPVAYVAEGSYYNNSPYQLGRVRLVFIVYDKNRKIVGFSQRDDFAVGPYERRSYKQIWPNVYGDADGTVAVFVETDPLDAANLSLPAVPADASSNLKRPQTQSR